MQFRRVSIKRTGVLRCPVIHFSKEGTGMAKGKGADLLLIILAILLPFVAVFLKKGVGKDLLINIILCIFFYIPGIIHALWVVLK